MMDYYEAGTVTRWFVLECGDCEHTWDKTMEVNTYRYGEVIGSYTCPECGVSYEGELHGEDWRDWEGDN